MGEELTLGLAESGAGPWAVALGAGALAVLLVSRELRPAVRPASSGASTESVERSNAVATPERPGRFGSLVGAWRRLVDEARAEYEAGRGSSSGSDRMTPGVTRAVQPATVPAPVGRGRRDASGRFTRRSENGVSGR